MKGPILITGGAGFIGSHLCDELLRAGHDVRALDVLDPQIHGRGARRPAYLDPRVELQIGDVRDPAAVLRALAGVRAVFHLAAAVGVGQSMYEIARYTDVNARGTAVLLEALVERPVERLVVASSMSVYGEGRYRDVDGRDAEARERTPADLRARRWEPRGPDGEALEAAPTSETKPPALASVYALGKYEQERMALIVGRAYGIPTVALRLFNVYGPRQALSNPYTGVLAIFAARLMHGRAPVVFEDGAQRRDFVSVHDVARACRLALSADAAAYEVINVGSGQTFTIREIAERMGRALEREIAPEITGQYRVGDVRHCFADVGKAKALLGFEPQVPLSDGIAELARWLSGGGAPEIVDRVGEMRAELSARGLAR
jgi:dTDP-L-rhamnose 4-epimerase